MREQLWVLIRLVVVLVPNTSPDVSLTAEHGFCYAVMSIGQFIRSRVVLGPEFEEDRLIWRFALTYTSVHQLVDLTLNPSRPHDVVERHHSISSVRNQWLPLSA